MCRWYCLSVTGIENIASYRWLYISSSLHNNGIGCWVRQMYVGCIMYADDIILLSPSMQGLQDMLNVCYSVSTKLSLQFNCWKCHLIAFSCCAHQKHGPLLLGSDTVSWANSVKYLEVHVVSGRKLSFDITPVKRAFFMAANSIWGQCQGMDESLQLSLLETYYLFIYLLCNRT